MTPKNLPTLLFDLDGTLVDSLPDLALALNRLLAELEASPLSLREVTTMVGDGAAKLVERALAARSLSARHHLSPTTQRFLEIYQGATVVETRPYPAVVETLNHLKGLGYRMAVCTNKPQAPSAEILEQLQLTAFFDGLAGGDRYSAKKPDALHITALLAEIGADTEQAVMIGDSINDLLAAQNAGIPSIWCRFGYGDQRCEGVPKALEVSHFAELRDLEYACFSI